MCSFVINAPQETNEDLEQEQEPAQPEKDIPEGYEEQDLAEASHIILAGADNMMDMEPDINEADVEVGSITATAQRRDLEAASACTSKVRGEDEVC